MKRPVPLAWASSAGCGWFAHTSALSWQVCSMIYHGLPVCRVVGRLAARIRLPVGCGAPWGALVLFHMTVQPPAHHLRLNHMMVSGFQAQQVDQPGCVNTFLISDYIIFANLLLVRANHMANQDSKGGQIDFVSG